ncbi:hypothetical protein ACFFRR_009073 [Megaselia abdita]
MLSPTETVLDLLNLTLKNDTVNKTDDDYIPYGQRPETYIVPVVFLIIFVVGVIGNGTLVIIFFRHRSMRNIPNTYILSLAMADLLVIIVCVPLASILYTVEAWPWGSTMCRVTEFAKDISIGVSVFTLTALSGERYCAIVNPLRKIQTKPLTVFTASMIWLLALLFALPAAIISDTDTEVLSNNKEIAFCTPFGKNRTSRTMYTKYTVVGKALIYYIIPLVVIGALYLLMAHRLRKSAREITSEIAGPQSRNQARARRYVARMVVVFVVVFFACFFPYHVFQLWFHLHPKAMDDFDQFWNILRIVGFCTSFFNSCVNPVALYCVSGVFREHFNHYLCCRPLNSQFRSGYHSSVVGAGGDTTVVSLRRSIHNPHRSSIHINNSSSKTFNNNLHRQQSLQLKNNQQQYMLAVPPSPTECMVITSSGGSQKR